MAAFETAEAVRSALAARFAEDRRVAGVGIGADHGKYVVRVHLASKRGRPNIETQINGVPIQVDVIGNVAAQVQ